MMRVIYPGSFDPPTRGHVDMVRRGARLFGEVIVLVMGNPNKHTRLSLEERAALLEKCLAGEKGVRVEIGGRLLADEVKRFQAKAILRGVRSEADYQAERPVADGFLDVFGVETVFVQCRGGLTYISSSMVRELLKQGGPVEQLVPPEIIKEIEAAYR